ncbi:MAG: threonine/serine exporter family protein [Propionibacteriaceae bacterium]|nr:threonine/serine exporter family protein [Propionibacteriaceae bacterium]
MGIDYFGGGRLMMARLQAWAERLFREPIREEVAAPPTEVDPRRAAAVVDLALRAAEMAIQTGAVTSDATSYALTITSAYGVVADVDVTFTSILISYHRRGRAEPITGFRGVRQRLTNYTQLTQLLRLIDDIGTGNVELEAARVRLDALRSHSRPYRIWVITLGQTVTGVGVAAILGGRPGEMALAALANTLMFLVQYALTRTQLSVFFIQALGAAVPTALAMWVMHVRAGELGWFSMVSPSLIVSAGIVTALAGVGVVGAARDAMDGNLITAGARTFDAVMQTAGIIVGVSITLWAGLALGVPGYIAPTGGYANPSALQIVWAILIALGVAVGFQLGLRALPFVALLAGTGFAVYQWSLPLVGNWPAAASLGAVVVGFMAQFIVGRFRIPLIALVTTGVVALMPGSALYRGLYELIRSIDEPISVQAQISLGNAVMVGLGLAAGSTFGAQLARPVGMPTAKLFRVAELRTLRRSRKSTTNTEVAR